eukprot:PhF_6_TR7276/c2_g1_i4/m.10862
MDECTVRYGNGGGLTVTRVNQLVVSDVRIRNNGMRTEHYVGVGHLSKLMSLTSLDIRDCEHITEKGVEALSTLTSLILSLGWHACLRHNQIGEICEKVFHMVPVHSALARQH